MDCGHADEDLCVVVAAFLFPDVERPQSSLGGLEGRNLRSRSFADGLNLSRFFDGFFSVL